MKYATPIFQFFCNPQVAFIVPLYQRRYAWEPINCKRLWDDIIKARSTSIQSHFFGSIVTVQESLTDLDLLVIDGQQRITTLSLIFLAISNAVKNGDMRSDNPSLLDKRLENYLYAIFHQGQRNIKLYPIEQDMKAYDALFSNNKKDFIEGTGITNNYYYFYNQVSHVDCTAEELIAAIEKLIVIDLRLDISDNPQLIFESLNSTGKDLTEADKVRNYLLMSLDKQQQSDYYHKYWAKIENLTDVNELGQADPTMFIRDYLTIRLRRICNISNLYFEFKEYDLHAPHTREEFMKELLQYATYYDQITHANTGSVRLDKKLRQLASIGSTVANPFYMSFFEYADVNRLDEDEIYQVLSVTENYWARRIICGYPANALNKVFATLHYDILRIIRQHEIRNLPLQSPYSELLKYVLLKKQGTAQFPQDQELSDSFLSRQIYKLPIDYRYFLFERMENENSKNGVRTVVDEMQKGTITIEHIMPQTLNAEWRRALGPNSEEIHEKYLHTFANLTLTGYNSNYGNRPFVEKRDGYVDKNGNKVDGFSQAGFHLSQFLIQCEKWTEDEILKREEDLLKRFMGMWPMLQTNYSPIDPTETISLNDADELTGRSITAFIYRSEKHEVTSWKEMLVRLCEVLYKERPNDIEYLCQKNEWWLYTKQESNWRTKFADNCWVTTQNDTQTKRKIIQHIFTQCGIPETDLYFQLKPTSESQNDE